MLLNDLLEAVRSDGNSIAYFSRRDLIRRGWTKGLVKKWCGTPDRSEPQAHPKRQRALWLTTKILEIEIDPRFSADMKSRESFRNRAKTAREASFDQARCAAQEIDLSNIGIPTGFELAVEKAIRRLEGELLDESGRPIGWDDFAIRYVLDACQPAFTRLDEWYGKPGVVEARRVLTHRILLHVAKQSTALAAACARYARIHLANSHYV